MNKLFSIGLMSGTSMDGIDAALILSDGSASVEEIAHVSLAYDNHFKILLKAAEYATKQFDGDLSAAKNHFLASLSNYLQLELNIEDYKLAGMIISLSAYLLFNDKAMITFDDVVQKSTELHAQAINLLLKKQKMTAKQINVIGYHGQTVFHSPTKKVTIQLGDGALLANFTGIPVINDFRTQDILSGGQGAPFAPLYHQALAIRDKRLPLAVVNCGGIANVTIIHGPLAEQTVGFDTGPGNGLIDRMVKSRTQGKECMDENAVYGIKGHVHEDVLQALYARSIILQDQNFFDLPAPKSLDINDLQLIPDLETLSLEDACATLEAFTADTIVRALEHVHAPIPTQWVLTGGGWHNPVIHQQFVTRLTAHFGLQPVCIKLAKDIGWNSAAIEAQLFAYLAIRSLKKMPISYPNITHVPMPLCGGTLHAII